MKIIKNPTPNSWPAITQRPVYSYASIEKLAKGIFSEVKRRGDSAVKKYTRFFDECRVKSMLATSSEISAASISVTEKLKEAIQTAKRNIEKFHAPVFIPQKIETTEGVVCWQEKRAIESVGLYVPGGTAPLFSTVLMLAIPAKLAGCQEIILCTPPDKKGNIPSTILYAASLCGITKIYKSGGIQAIAALTFGTESIPAVHKIAGPGNQYVTAAKQMATHHGVAIDMPAGPSELLIYADDTSNPVFVAADLLSQAEHGEDSQVVLVTNSLPLIAKVQKEIVKQMAVLPRREIIAKSLENSWAVYFDMPQPAMEFINAYAPEHFMISCDAPDFFVKNIRNAGSVFVGHYTPESAGDYASGTNHTLPTNGSAKAYSGISVDTFLKSISFQKISRKGIQNLGQTIEIMAEAEQLSAHKNAVSIRLKKLNEYPLK